MMRLNEHEMEFHNGFRYYSTVDIGGIRGWEIESTNIKDSYIRCKVDAIYKGKPVLSMADAFKQNHHIEEVDLSDVDMTNMTHIDNIFYGCEGLKKVKFPNMKAKNLRFMQGAFAYSKIRNIEFNGLEVGEMVDMSHMFLCCSKLEKLNFNNFKIGSIMKMSNAFNGCSRIRELDLSMLNIRVTEPSDIIGLFDCCWGLDRLDISSIQSYTIGKCYPLSLFSKVQAHPDLVITGNRTVAEYIVN